MMITQAPKKMADLIGNTPLVDLSSMLDKPISLYAKCEFMNPGLSMKDRAIQYILLKAEREKKIQQGDTIICASSGNTGLSVAMQGAVRGYKVIVVTSEKCSVEKRNHILAFNAQLLITNEDEYMGYAGELARHHGYFDIDQYDNPDNPQAYYCSLGPEIWKQSGGKVSCLVMASSTFGCITGTARYLKEKNRDIKVVLADPLYSSISDYYRKYRKYP
ncbi:MAG: cysteine synthase family protein, partial [Candidatus Electrothrix sp. AR3]|nr:cysteine synthase family protein [Candidatus Electrothrix sp. AR3]